MKISKIADGLNIFIKYEPEGEMNHEHDIIYACGIRNLSPEDEKTLVGLGWFWDEEYDCWAIFT